MKKLGVFLFILALLLVVKPNIVMAAQSPDFEKGLTQYLSDISIKRGFVVTKDDMIQSLTLYDMKLEDFETIDELRSILGDVIQSDLSNLDSLYSTYSLDEQKVRDLLEENGEALEDYIFIDDLNYSLLFYTDDGVFERESDFDQKLVTYLEDVSRQRGFEITKDRLEAILEGYGTSLDQFETVNSLSDYLGEVIKSDLSNLDSYFKTYEMNQKSVLQLLEKNNKVINDYVYLDDLTELLETEEIDEPVIDKNFINQLLDVIGLTQEEMQNLESYFTGLEDYFTAPETLDRINSLSDKLVALAQSSTSDTITDEQAKQLEDIYKEYLTIFRIDLKYSLIKDGVQTSVTYSDLVKRKDLQGNDLRIAIYGTDNQFLADLTITSELFDQENVNLKDILVDAASDTINQVTQPSDVLSSNENVIKTVKGGKLPKTASGYLIGAFYGILITASGLLLLWKVKKVKKNAV